jgi:predicted alpha/beta hydrolase
MDNQKPTHLLIPATDGLTLAGSYFRGARPTLGTLILASAVGNRRQNYTAYAGYMAQHGWDVVTFDYRGVGDSQVAWNKAAAYRLVDWGEKDVAGVINWARARLESKRLALLGHSIGGQVVGFAPNKNALDALVGVAAQRGYWPYWPGWRKWGLYLFFRVFVPLTVKLRGRLALKFADLVDMPGGVALDWARAGFHPDFQDRNGAGLKPRFAQFRSPTLAISFSDDLSLAPERAVDVLFTEYYNRATLTRWHLRPQDLGVETIGHAGFFNPKVCPESLWQDTLRWLLEACPLKSPCNSACPARTARGCERSCPAGPSRAPVPPIFAP